MLGISGIEIVAAITAIQAVVYGLLMNFRLLFISPKSPPCVWMAFLLLMENVLHTQDHIFTGLEFLAIFGFTACPNTKKCAVQKEEKLIGVPEPPRMGVGQGNMLW